MNIENYNLNELENLLGIGKRYTELDVENAKTKIIARISNDDKLDINKKEDINIFLEKAKNQICQIKGLGQADNNINSFQNKIISQTGSNFVIEKPSVATGLKSNHADGRTVDSTNAPPGIINPINVRTIKRSVNVDTRFRPNYYTSSATDYHITLPIKVSNAISMRIASLEIPLSYYVISKKNGNSYFKLQFSDFTNPDLQTRWHIFTTIMIPDGNYEVDWQDATLATDITQTINGFISAANTETVWRTQQGDVISSTLYTAADAVTATGASNSYSSAALAGLRYNVDRTSGKSLFSYDPSVVTQALFTIVWGVDETGRTDLMTNLQFRLGWLLGFRVNAYTGYSIVSEGIFYCKGPRYAFLSIKDFQNSANDYFISAFNSSILEKDIIARINLTSIQQSEGIYQSGQDDGFSTQINRQRSYFGPVDIEKLEIKLLDEYGRIVDLNNMDWSMALTFECLYDS